MDANKSNLSLIGMPGAGKSTIGIILAKRLSYDFVDTDVLIQMHQQQALQQIVDQRGHLQLRRIEEKEILGLDLDHHIIATGGSAAYSDRAMTHLRTISLVVFLQVDYDELTRRIHNFASRGIAKAAGQTFLDLYKERQPLYEHYADITIDCNHRGQEETAELLANERQRLSPPP